MILEFLRRLGKKSEGKDISKPKKVIENKKERKVSSTRIGEIGEYKINIQLDQLPRESMFLSDVMVRNSESKSGYSQIDHLIISPYAIFVVETKNYTGTIYGDRNRKSWSVNGKFSMMNPFNQNYGHIQAVKGILGHIEDKHFISIVSFNKRGTFKVNEELRKIQSNDLIVYDTELTNFITRKMNVIKLLNENVIFTSDEISRMYKVLGESNITDEKIRNEHIEIINSKSKNEINHLEDSSTFICEDCGVKVTAKVANFCVDNEQRFKGKIYCYTHQKLY